MLKEMEYVYTIYRERSFSGAARKLFISQPALSAAIKKLESELGATLFDRGRKPIGLTQAGEYYIRSTEKIMDIQRDMAEYFASLSGQRGCSLNVGSSSFFCAHVLPRLALGFQQRYQSYAVNLSEANATVLEEKLRVGLLDFALTAEKLNEQMFHSLVFQEERIVLAVPAAWPINETMAWHRLSFEDIRSQRYLDERFPPVRMNAFQDEPFLLLNQGNDLYDRALAMCRNAGFAPRIEMYLDQIMTSYYVACDGGGITFIRDAITPYVAPTDRLCFYKIDDPLATRNLYLFYKKNDPLPKIVGDFISFLGL